MTDTLLSAPLARLEQRDAFVHRHLGPDASEIARMCATIGVADVDALIEQTVPAGIRLASPLPLAGAMPEHEALARLKAIAGRNVVKKSLIGMGYYGTHVPAVMLRNVLENPGWYTAYTPYQAEISQGRLEALLNYQQMVIDLTGLELANASLLDEATAAAEAMTMARRVSKSKSNVFFIDEACFAQTIDVVRTRAHYFGYELVYGKAAEAGSHDCFGALLQYPNARGEVVDLTTPIAELKAKGAVCRGRQRPDGPGAAQEPRRHGRRHRARLGAALRRADGLRRPARRLLRHPRRATCAPMPGRIIGVSKDARGKTALRMTLQTREQHIRREKANSNICTSQVLLANIAGFYAVYHGPQGLRTIAARIHRLPRSSPPGCAPRG
jgi:glycine dehydrogenase